MASCAPACCICCAMAQAMLRLLATPNTATVRPCKLCDTVNDPPSGNRIPENTSRAEECLADGKASALKLSSAKALLLGRICWFSAFILTLLGIYSRPLTAPGASDPASSPIASFRRQLQEALWQPSGI